mgnify:CR=1 FL=1
MLETTTIKFKEDFEFEPERCIHNHEALKVRRDKGEDIIIIGERDWRAIEEIGRASCRERV